MAEPFDRHIEIFLDGVSSDVDIVMSHLEWSREEALQVVILWRLENKLDALRQTVRLGQPPPLKLVN